MEFQGLFKDLETGNVRQLLTGPSGGTIVNPAESDITCGSTNVNDNHDIVAPRHRHAIIATRNDGLFAYAIARLSVPAGGYTAVTMRCAAGALCTDPTKGGLIIQSKTEPVQMFKTQWSAPQESFLIVGNKGTILDNAVNRLNELNNEALAGGVNCLN